MDRQNSRGTHEGCPRAGDGRVPFAHHREEDSSGEKCEDEVVPFHDINRSTCGLAAKIFTTEDTEDHRVELLCSRIGSESHDVVAAIYVDDFAGDAAAGVGGEEDSG